MAQVNKTPAQETVQQAAPVVDPMAKYNLAKLVDEHKTKSAVIRFLSSEGCTRSQIAGFMNIRYQHVRNVLTQPLKQVAPATEQPATAA